MTAIALVGLVPGVAGLLEAALQSEGYTVTRLTLDTDVVRGLVAAANEPTARPMRSIPRSSRTCTPSRRPRRG